MKNCTISGLIHSQTVDQKKSATFMGSTGTGIGAHFEAW